MIINWNGFSGCVIWEDVKHVVIEARKEVCISNDSSLEFLDMSEAIKTPEKVTCWSVLGLVGDDWELLHDSLTLAEAHTAAAEAFSHINKCHDINDVAKAVKEAFKWESGDWDWAEFDAIETKGLELILYPDGSLYFGEADEEQEDCYSVYGHYSDPNIGGGECLAIAWTMAEMKQLSKVAEALII